MSIGTGRIATQHRLAPYTSNGRCGEGVPGIGAAQDYTRPNYNERVLVYLPINWPKQRSNPLPPVVVHHGVNSTELQIIPGFGGHIFWHLVESGFPVISFEQGGPRTFGNNLAIATALQAKQFLMEQVVGQSDGPCFHLGFSMGGIAAMNMARAHPSAALAIAGVVPGVDLQVHAQPGAAFEDAVANAYGNHPNTPLSLDGWWPTHDPITYAAAGGLDGIPMKLWLGTNDATVPYSRQQAFLAARPATEAVHMSGVGHNPEPVPLGAVTEFFLNNLP